MADLGEGRTSAAKGDEGQEGKYLTFALGREEYGIGILKVKEIIGILPITLMPRTPEHMKGVINLRGK
jgi:purine-binding chemotaxis protein CheW